MDTVNTVDGAAVT